MADWPLPMPPQQQSNAPATSDQQKDPTIPPDWVKGGDGRFYPPDMTPDQRKQRENFFVRNDPMKATEDDDSDKQSWLWTPIVSPQEGAQFWGWVVAGSQDAAKIAKQTSEKSIAAGGQPGRAARAEFVSGALDTAGRLTSEASTPAQIAMLTASAGAEAGTALGMKEAAGLGKYLLPALRGPGEEATAWFGLNGIKQMVMPQQEGENDADFWERKLLGASAFVCAASAAPGVLRDVLTKQFGLDPDMAAKVEERVLKLKQIRSDRDASIHNIEADRDANLAKLSVNDRKSISKIEQQMIYDQNELEATTTGQVSSIESMAQRALDKSQGRISALQRDQLHEGARVMSDVALVTRELQGDRLSNLEGTLSKPFNEIAKEVKGNVATENELRGIVEDSYSQFGLNKEEIPSSVYKSMTKVSPEIADQAREDPSLVIGYKKFSDLNRLRSDLYAAAQREKGPRKAALETASEKVSKIQEHAADMAGQGQKYRDAKGEYLKAMRSIFSNYFQDWVNLDDDREQDMLAKVGTLMAREPSGNFDQTARALRTTLKAYGIDVSALDDFFRQGTEEQAKTERTKKEAKEGTQRATELQSKLKIGITESSKAAVERQSGMTADQIKAENERAKNAIKPAEEKAGQQEKEVERNPIIPG